MSSLKAKVKVDIKYTQNVLQQEGKKDRKIAKRILLVASVLFAVTFILSCISFELADRNGWWVLQANFHQLLVRAVWAMTAHTVV